MYKFFICTRSISHLKCGVYVYENALMLDYAWNNSICKVTFEHFLAAKDKAYPSKKNTKTNVK